MLSFFNRLLARIWAVFSAQEFDQELDAELECHLELRTEDLIRQGMQPEEAKRAARIELGGIAQLHEAHRETRALPFVKNVVTDCGYVVRQLRKSPVFAVAAILTLAIGIGANTAIFSLVDQLILRLLPVQDPQRIVALVGVGEFYGDSQGTNPISYAMSIQQLISWLRRLAGLGPTQTIVHKISSLLRRARDWSSLLFPFVRQRLTGHQ